MHVYELINCHGMVKLLSQTTLFFMLELGPGLRVCFFYSTYCHEYSFLECLLRAGHLNGSLDVTLQIHLSYPNVNSVVTLHIHFNYPN